MLIDQLADANTACWLSSAVGERLVGLVWHQRDMLKGHSELHRAVPSAPTMVLQKFTLDRSGSSWTMRHLGFAQSAGLQGNALHWKFKHQIPDLPLGSVWPGVSRFSALKAEVLQTLKLCWVGELRGFGARGPGRPRGWKVFGVWAASFMNFMLGPKTTHPKSSRLSGIGLTPKQYTRCCFL